MGRELVLRGTAPGGAPMVDARFALGAPDQRHRGRPDFSLRLVLDFVSNDFENIS